MGARRTATTSTEQVRCYGAPPARQRTLSAGLARLQQLGVDALWHRGGAAAGLLSRRCWVSDFQVVCVVLRLASALVQLRLDHLAGIEVVCADEALQPFQHTVLA